MELELKKLGKGKFCELKLKIRVWVVSVFG